LIDQLGTINSADEAAAWAHRNLPAKNTLTAADAKTVEERFQARLSGIVDHQGASGASNAVADQTILSAGHPHASADQKASTVARKRSRHPTVGTLGKTVRLRDKEHRKFVARQACLVCGRAPSDPHHLTFTQPRALGHRVSDEFTVPLRRVHHRELHRSGDETAWWRKLNIDPLPVALRLWQHTRADGELTLASQGIAQPQAAKTSDISAQDRASTNLDQRADAGNSMPKNIDGLTSG
jgi:hypothetical protein